MAYFKQYTLVARNFRNKFTVWDAVALTLVIGFFILLKNTIGYMVSPVPETIVDHVSLNPKNLPEYVLRSITRIALALIVSVIFSIVYALLAAKNKFLQKPMIALLDIMQSIPILGYISFTIAGFIALAPNKMLGYELAVIFTVFTCQVWNITYCLYQSLITIPDDMKNAEKIFHLNPIQKFILVEFPYAIPALIWNIMISVSNSWFFTVASEAIIEGTTSFFLPGVGSYIAAAISEQNLHAIFYAIAVLTFVIFLYDKFLFKPLVEWSKKFKHDFNQISSTNYNSWDHKLLHSKFLSLITYPFKGLYKYLLTNPLILSKHTHKLYIHHKVTTNEKLQKLIYYGVIFSLSLIAFYKIISFLYLEIPFAEVKHTLFLGLVTTFRIIVVMIITIVIWLPISIYIGFRPNLAKIAQPLALALASFPANLIFPLCVFLIQKYNLNPNTWLSILFVISIQWYIVFNVIAGASAFPEGLKEVVKTFDIKGMVLMCKIILPSILPNFLIGAITAWGSAWNTTILAETAKWGNTTLEATGIGSYVTEASTIGNMPHIILGITVMLFYIEIFNKCFWRPLFNYADKMEQFK